MTYEEIESWAKKYDLSWKEIYELDSEYQSLLLIDKELGDALKEGKKSRRGPSYDINDQNH